MLVAVKTAKVCSPQKRQGSGAARGLVQANDHVQRNDFCRARGPIETVKRRLLLLVFVLVSSIAIVSQAQSSSSSSGAKAFINGRWFTGKDFESGTFYTVNGFLTARKPTGLVRTIDLHSGFVVPAFADAHNHSPSSRHDFTDANRAFLDAGVFYVLNAGGNAESANSIRDQLGTAATVDAIFADALFTCPGGHPKPLSRISCRSRRSAVQQRQTGGGVSLTRLIRSPTSSECGLGTSRPGRIL